MRFSLLIGLVAFLSGASALAFETVWVRQATIVFGNSVWGGSIVLASFMGGLALGGAIAGSAGPSARRPLYVYAWLEIAVGAAGLVLAVALPSLTVALAPLFRPFLDALPILNLVRLPLAFLLLLVPTTAMGATLPMLVKALSLSGPDVGPALGFTYGCNTLGAVVGALLPEGFVIAIAGMRGTAASAAAVNLIAASLALLCVRGDAPLHAAPDVASLQGGARRIEDATRWPKRLLLAAFLSGAAMLALEVVWFRFLLLFVAGTSMAFAMMLAVVLTGIALGGFCGGMLLRARATAYRLAAPVALLSGFLCATSYAGFEPDAGHPELYYHDEWRGLLLLALRLMLPVCVTSGALYALLAQAIKGGGRDTAAVVGLLASSNTAGAMAGALAGGFFLLPVLGIERSFILIAATYGLVAACTLAPDGIGADGRAVGISAVSAAMLGGALLAFPHGAMARHFLPFATARYRSGGSRPIAIREGLNETLVLLENDLLGKPRDYLLLTNGFSMAGTDVLARRYMKLFVYWPIALHPAPRRALLVSYGTGVTCKALADTAELHRIDVVDTSRDILDMADLVYPSPGQNPLRDDRVRVHVEDGRFFLQTTDERYDIITSEPPPPVLAGVVNLYSREYFQLLHERLAPGGIATYWLPAHQMAEGDARSVIRSFCDAFPDCSLWQGNGLDWMLSGTRGLEAPAREDRIADQWRRPAAAAELRALGFESPEILFASFLGDADFLHALTRDTLPVTDDFPHRLSHPARKEPLYGIIQSPDLAAQRFRESRYLRRLLPAGFRDRCLGMLPFQRILMGLRRKRPIPDRIPDLDLTLRLSPLVTLPQWLLGTNEDELAIVEAAAARGARGPFLSGRLGMRALSLRRFEEAEELFGRAARFGGEDAETMSLLRLYAATRSHCTEHAVDLALSLPGPMPAHRPFFRYMAAVYGFPDPRSPSLVGPRSPTDATMEP